MRSSVAILIVCACRINDLDQPIGIIPKDLTDDFVANLDEGGQCWNLKFGTKFVSGPAAADAAQQVEVFFDNMACLDAAAEVQGEWPVKLAICPPIYWPGLLSLVNNSRVTPFRVVSHELGHVANIIIHPDDPLAVMQGGGYDFAPMFAAADVQLFDDANSNYIVPPSACNEVVRSYRPGTGGAVSHCACDNGPPDLAIPTAVVAAPQLAPAFPALLAAATRCYNLHYGLHLVADGDAEQHIYIERCFTGSANQHAFDTGSALACVLDDTTVYDAIDAIALALGEHTLSSSGLPFSTTGDTYFATHYGTTVACTKIAVDPVTSECSCAD